MVSNLREDLREHETALYVRIGRIEILWAFKGDGECLYFYDEEAEKCARSRFDECRNDDTEIAIDVPRDLIMIDRLPNRFIMHPLFEIRTWFTCQCYFSSSPYLHSCICL